jgi:ATP-binding cassette subfamily B protein
MRPTIRDGSVATQPRGPLAVEIDRVTFHYQDGESKDEGRRTKDESPSTSPVVRPWLDSVLDDVSFSIAPGAVLGLLGRTGSGKSTIARLLYRFYDPTGGVIRLGGVDLRLGHLRERVALVTQDVQLFHGTVRDNLTLFDATVEDAAIRRVLDELGLAAWFAALPKGLETPLGPGGHGLSAGEAQLLAFTRAFLGDPSVVILHEASSRLDPATEHLIERAVDRLLRGRTGIIIAHRLATVRRADDIVILEDGRVREYGPRAALEADPSSRFAALLRTGLESSAAGRGREEALV